MEYRKKAPEYFADAWQKSSSLVACPPLQLNGSRLIHKTNGGISSSEISSHVASYPGTLMDINVTSTALQSIERMIANLQRDTPSHFLASRKLLYSSLAGMLGQKQFEVFMQELFDKTQSKETDLQKFQQSIKDHFEQQAAKYRYFFDVPSQFYQSDDHASHRPGEGGSLVVSIEGGRLNYVFKADPLKSPRAAGALIAAHLLISYIKWMRLSPGVKKQ